MSNANEPAFPTIYADMSQNGQREIYCDNTGLTKRERFAIAAPEVPEWFTVDCEPFVSPLSADENAHMRKFSPEDYGSESWDLGSQACHKEREARDAYCKNINIKRFFAWRAFYADALLAELAKEQSK